MIVSNPYTHDPRVYSEAMSLVNSGHDVTIIGWDRNNKYAVEEWNKSVHIIRIQNKGILRILPGVLIKNPLWWRKAFKRGLKLFYDGWKFDVVHCHDLDTLPAGVWLKKKTKCKLVYDAHEIYGYMIEKNVNNLIVKLVFYMEKKLIKHASYIITVDNGYANYFKSIINNIPLTIIRNCKTLLGEYQKPSYEKFTLIYIGTINNMRFFPQMIYIIGKIKNVQLFVISINKNEFYYKMKNISKKFDNINFLNQIPINKVLYETLKAHVVICLFDTKNRLYTIGSPNKLFEAMVTGRPIIVTKNTNAGNIVDKEKCGISIEYSEEKFEETIKLLRDNPNLCEELGKNGLKAAKEKYNWDNEEKKLLSLYKKLNIKSSKYFN